jgi:hypothetical protein
LYVAIELQSSIVDYKEDEKDQRFAEEVRREHLWEDMEQVRASMQLVCQEILH